MSSQRPMGLSGALLTIVAFSGFGCVKADKADTATAPNATSTEQAAPTPSQEESPTATTAAPDGAGTYSQKPSGLLASIDDSKSWSAGVEKIEGSVETLSERCEAKPAVDINYESFAPAVKSKTLSVFEVMAYCHEVVSGLAANCGWDDKTVQAAIRANVKRVLCEFDDTATNNKVNFSFSDGTFRGGLNQSSANIHFDSQRWTASNVPPAP